MEKAKAPGKIRVFVMLTAREKQLRKTLQVVPGIFGEAEYMVAGKSGQEKLAAEEKFPLYKWVEIPNRLLDPSDARMLHVLLERKAPDVICLPLPLGEENPLHMMQSYFANLVMLSMKLGARRICFVHPSGAVTEIRNSFIAYIRMIWIYLLFYRGA